MFDGRQFFAPLALTWAVAAGCGGAAHPEAPVVSFVDRAGKAVTFDEVARRMSGADAALVGEIHGHARGLETVRALFDHVAASSPNAALSLEMLERDEQPAVDAYLAGAIDASELTRRRDGAELPHAHQAMVDRARASGLPVIAANAPRRLAKRARLEGFAALGDLTGEARGWFALPVSMPDDAYRARFAAAMGLTAHEGEGKRHGDAGQLDGFYRAQLLWDATMADSVASALARGRAPVVHVVGRFHVEQGGGLVQLLHAARPGGRTFTLVVAEGPEPGDDQRADVLAFVGPQTSGHR